ncbi:hypothetical protein F5148DRAFT_176937 [Russula earlei]|uniref:Uncharacterized protein n=1 Tax=Russula earlei TaxID=71964 RepID=A0ACC0U5U1_9AGAM|nr:hypothetical protein F5148DRAFT_176937 [Russula earlei]
MIGGTNKEQVGPIACSRPYRKSRLGPTRYLVTCNPPLNRSPGSLEGTKVGNQCTQGTASETTPLPSPVAESWPCPHGPLARYILLLDDEQVCSGLLLSAHVNLSDLEHQLVLSAFQTLLDTSTSPSTLESSIVETMPSRACPHIFIRIPKSIVYELGTDGAWQGVQTANNAHANSQPAFFFLPTFASFVRSFLKGTGCRKTICISSRSQIHDPPRSPSSEVSLQWLRFLCKLTSSVASLWLTFASLVSGRRLLSPLHPCRTQKEVCRYSTGKPWMGYHGGRSRLFGWEFVVGTSFSQRSLTLSFPVEVKTNRRTAYPQTSPGTPTLSHHYHKKHRWFRGVATRAIQELLTSTHTGRGRRDAS